MHAGELLNFELWQLNCFIIKKVFVVKLLFFDGNKILFFNSH